MTGSLPSEDSSGTVADAVFAQVRRLLPSGLDAGITLDSSLYEIGLDSLARMEALNGLEETFGVRFSEESLSDMETCRDLVEYIEANAVRGGLKLFSPSEAAVPAGRPSAAVPAGRPSAAVPAGRPSAAVPAGRPSAAVPAGRPSAAVPAGRPSAAVPAGRPSAAVPAERPSAAVPAERPSAAVPAERPSAAVPGSGCHCRLVRQCR